MYLYLAILLFGLFSGGASMWKVQEWRHDANDKARIEHEAEVKRQQARGIDHAAEGHEQDKAAIEVRYRTVTKEVERVIQSEPIYRDGICLSDSGLRAISAALGSAPAASQPASAVQSNQPAR